MTNGQGLDLESLRRRAALLAAIRVPRPYPMLHEIWLSACAEAFDPDGRFEVVTVGDAASPVAGAAFARRGARLRLRLSLLGRRGAVGADRRVLPRRGGRGIPCGSRDQARIAGPLRPLSRRVPVRRRTEAERAPKGPNGRGGRRRLALHRAGSELAGARVDVSSRMQRDLRRKRRKAEAMGAVSFEVATPTGGDVKALLDEAIAVEAASWKARSRTAIAFDETLLPSSASTPGWPARGASCASPSCGSMARRSRFSSAS